MKTPKIIILSVFVEGDQKGNEETANSNRALAAKYGRPGREVQSTVMPVEATIRLTSGKEVGTAGNGTIDMPQTERDRVVKFCAGGGPTGMYLLVHATENYFGTAEIRVTGATLGELVRDWHVPITYICVIACNAGVGERMDEFCNTFAGVAADMRPSGIAGYRNAVFVDCSADNEGGKQVHAVTQNVQRNSVFPKKFLAKNVRALNEKPPDFNKAKYEAKTLREKKAFNDQEAMWKIKSNYKSLYVFDTVSEKFVNTRT